MKLTYNTNGLRNLSIQEAVREVSKAGYDGIELSIHQNHLNPASMSDFKTDELTLLLEEVDLEPVCLATGADLILSDVRFEPSLITKDTKGRQERIDYITFYMDTAKYLNIPIVNFASGIKADNVSEQQAYELLVEGVNSILASVRDVMLVIEPEPNFFIESTKQAIHLINDINNPNFALNMDIGHVNCVEDDFYEAVDYALPYTKHVHIEDIKDRVHVHEIPGDGDIDFQRIVNTLKKHNYQGAVSVELYPKNDIWHEALTRSFNYLSPLMR